jgi:hypothetical protein
MEWIAFLGAMDGMSIPVGATERRLPLVAGDIVISFDLAENLTLLDALARTLPEHRSLALCARRNDVGLGRQPLAPL